MGKVFTEVGVHCIMRRFITGFLFMQSGQRKSGFQEFEICCLRVNIQGEGKLQQASFRRGCNWADCIQAASVMTAQKVL